MLSHAKLFEASYITFLKPNFDKNIMGILLLYK